MTRMDQTTRKAPIRTPTEIGLLSRPGALVPVGAFLALVGALVFRLGLLHAPGEFDELYHLLAARGWVETGTPRILEGEYWRGALFTRMVAGLFTLTETRDLPTARLVSVAAGALVPVILFVWVSRAIGPGTAILAASFAVLWPQGILESQFSRFYAVQVFTFFSGAVAFYIFITNRSTARLLSGLVAALCWSLAFHFQLSSVIGVSAALLGGALILVVRHRPGPRGWVLIGSVLVSLSLLFLILPGSGDILSRAWTFYRWTPGHAEALRDYYGFYFDQLQSSYGVLWLASLVLVPLGLRINVALTLYCTTIFLVCFLAHSFGGMKALRYLSYAMPFLFVLWAMGLRVAFDLLTAALRPRLRIGTAVLGGLAVIASTNFVPRSMQLAAGEGLPPRGDWSNGLTIIGDWIDAPFVATTRELHQIAHIGPYDILFSESRVSELDPPRDFAVDRRTGRPVAGDADNILRVLSCVPDGLLVTSPHWWQNEGWNKRLATALEANRTILTTREDGAILALRWQNRQPGRNDCAALFDLLRYNQPLIPTLRARPDGDSLTARPQQ